MNFSFYFESLFTKFHGFTVFFKGSKNAFLLHVSKNMFGNFYSSQETIFLYFQYCFTACSRRNAAKCRMIPISYIFCECIFNEEIELLLKVSHDDKNKNVLTRIFMI